MARRYEPPKQSGFGQFIDSIFIVALVYAAMFLPLILGLTGGGTVTNLPETISWESLGQNPTMAAQWEKLGYTPESAAEIISTRFDYTIDPVWFIITAVVIGGYFLFLVKYSDREYRDVISERFD